MKRERGERVGVGRRGGTRESWVEGRGGEGGKRLCG